MAKTLSNLGIATGQTIKASEVSQSIDALTGTEAYDITISGSLTVTGSTSIDGDVFINPTSATTGTSVLTINPTTGKIFRTGSYSAGGGGSVGTLNQVTTLGSTTTNDISTGAITAGGAISSTGAITAGAGISSTGAITAGGAISSTGQISASGNLFASLADNGTTTFKTVVYDPATGKFYRTGSFSSALTSEGGKFDVGDDEIVFDTDGTGGSGLKGDGSGSIELTGPGTGSGKLDVKDGEIEFDTDGSGGGTLKGDGSGGILVTDKDGNGGKLDTSGGDGNGEVVIGKGGKIQGDTSKGKIAPVLDSGTQEDGHFQVLKNDGTTGKISANIKAGTNTTIIDDNYHSTGYIELTGSIYSKSNITSSILELRGGLLSIKNDGAQSQALFYCESNNAHFTAIKAQPHSLYVGGNVTTLLPAYNLDFSKPDFQANITASGNISASGNLIAKKIIVDAEGLNAGNLDIQFGNDADTGIASIPSGGDKIGIYTGGSYRIAADNFGVQISTELNVDKDTRISGSLNVTGSEAHITASGNISSSGNLIAKKIIVDAEGSGPNDLDIQVGSSNTGIASIPAGNQIGFYTGGSYRLLANNSEVQISTELKVHKDTRISGSLNVTGSEAHITASGNISASGNIFGDRIVASTYIGAETLDIGTGTTEIDSIVVSLPNLPTNDPGVAGRVWRDGTDLKISTG